MEPIEDDQPTMVNLLEYSRDEDSINFSVITEEVVNKTIPHVILTLDQPSSSSSPGEVDILDVALNLDQPSSSSSPLYYNRQYHSRVKSIAHALDNLYKGKPQEGIISAKKKIKKVQLGEAVINYLKTIRNDKFYNNKLMEIIFEIFGDKITDDDDMASFLASELGYSSPAKFIEQLNNWNALNFIRTSKTSLPNFKKSIIYETWIENSRPTAGRRLGRDIVTMKESDFNKIYDGIKMEDGVIREGSRRNKPVVEATRYVATRNTREIKKNIFMKYQETISYGFIIFYKPFYIGVLTEREKILCMYGFCLNLHFKFMSLMSECKRQGGKSYTSSSGYSMEHVTCSKGSHNYWNLECCNGECTDCSNIVPELQISDNQTVVLYNEFCAEKKHYLHHITKLEKVTTCVERKTKTLDVLSLKSLVDDKSNDYLLHQCMINREKHIFQKLIQSTSEIGDISWIDFPENLANTPKHQPQDAHFNQRQSSLCCTVQITLGDAKDNRYIYHLSDINVHNASYTSAVTEDLHNISYNSGIFRVKSDNCKAQFKCRYVFGRWSAFSREKNVKVILYYGVKGHGKGLVDSMSSFGVEEPLRREIINEDFWYQNSYEIVQYLKTKCVDDRSKVYKVIDSDDLISREERKKEYDLKIIGLEKLCMLSFSPDWTVKGARYYCACSVCICGDFDECDTCIGKIYHQAAADDGDKGEDDYDKGGDDNDSDRTLDKEDDESVGREEYELQGNALMEVADPGSYIALHSSNDFELFYLCEVIEKCTAKNIEQDDNGHIFLSGENYLKCRYLQLLKEAKGAYHYKKLTNIVFINPLHILCLYVNITEDLTLNSIDYQFIADSTF